MPVDHHRKHDQLHKVLDDEEVVELEHKGSKLKYKLDHAAKQVFIEGGPEEDCAWKRTNSSYDSVVSQLGRALSSPSVPSGIESDKPIDLDLAGVPGFPVPSEPAPDSDSL